MTAKAIVDIQGRALLELHKAKWEVQICAKQLDDIADNMLKVGNAIKQGTLRVENGKLFDGDLILDYIAYESIVRAVEGMRAANVRKFQAKRKCRKLGL